MSKIGFANETSIGNTVEWYTPPEIFEWMGLRFDLDPCTPVAGPVPWIPADRHYTEDDDGLKQPWSGSVWLNPPFSRIKEFMAKMARHAHGIAIGYARTETRWFQDSVGTADLILLISPRVAFIDQAGNVGKQPACGSFLAAWGERHADALRKMGREGHGLVAQFPLQTRNLCRTCNGEGRIANSEDGEPWSVWAKLPPGSDLAVRMGLVRPIGCPNCGGLGVVKAHA